MLYRFLCALFALALMGCGDNVNTTGTDTATSTSTATVTNTATSTGLSAAGGYLTGYIVSAFNMTVNGQQYSDSESFYGAQLTALQAQAKAAGYAGYSMNFDAQIGLDDLADGMTVYVEAANGTTGFAGNAQVQENSEFMLSVPDGCGNETFDIRANKRVSVTLTSPDQQTTVKWCYNFSSTDTQGTIQSPVILSSFVTSLTQYECDDSTNAGMQIPQNPNAPTATATGTDISTGTATGTGVAL